MNDSFSLPLAMPDSEACATDGAPALRLDGELVTGTAAAGEAGLNVTSRPSLSTAVHWLTDGHGHRQQVVGGIDRYRRRGCPARSG